MSATEDGSEFKKGGKKAKGFAANPHLINKGGRPKGSRNKKSIIKAQLQLDDMSVMATEVLQALMMNDKDILGITDDVPLSLRLNAAKEALNKAIANEKDKEAAVAKEAAEKVSEAPEQSGPIFSPVPVKRA